MKRNIDVEKAKCNGNLNKSVANKVWKPFQAKMTDDLISYLATCPGNANEYLIASQIKAWQVNMKVLISHTTRQSLLSILPLAVSTHRQIEAQRLVSASIQHSSSDSLDDSIDQAVDNAITREEDLAAFEDAERPSDILAICREGFESSQSSVLSEEME